jgi:ribosomal protein L11 methylase PrmA
MMQRKARLVQLYTEQFYKDQRDSSRRSAREIVPLILTLIQPKSVIDVGCGVGTWLYVFKELGCKEIFGVDGDYVLPKDF